MTKKFKKEIDNYFRGNVDNKQSLIQGEIKFETFSPKYDIYGNMQDRHYIGSKRIMEQGKQITENQRDKLFNEIIEGSPEGSVPGSRNQGGLIRQGSLSPGKRRSALGLGKSPLGSSSPSRRLSRKVSVMGSGDLRTQ